MTRFQRGRSVPGHAPAQSMNEADRPRATETGQIDQLATGRYWATAPSGGNGVTPPAPQDGVRHWRQQLRRIR